MLCGSVDEPAPQCDSFEVGQDEEVTRLSTQGQRRNQVRVHDLARHALFTPQHCRGHRVAPAARSLHRIAPRTKIIFSKACAKDIHSLAAPQQPRKLPRAKSDAGSASIAPAAFRWQARRAAERSTGMDGGQIHNVAENCGTPGVRMRCFAVEKTNSIHRPSAVHSSSALLPVPVARPYDLLREEAVYVVRHEQSAEIAKVR